MDQAPYPLGTKVLLHQWPTTSGTLTLFQGRPGRRWSGRYCPPTGFPGNRTRDHWISRLRRIPWATGSPNTGTLWMVYSWSSGSVGKIGTNIALGSWLFGFRSCSGQGLTGVVYPIMSCASRPKNLWPNTLCKIFCTQWTCPFMPRDFP